MPKRAKDIEELEWLLNNAGSDKELCDKAIEIVDRLIYEVKQYQKMGDQALLDEIERQSDDFLSILEEIKRRKHDHVLDDFFNYGKKIQEDFDF